MNNGKQSAYPNLRAEMARRGITSQKIAQALRLNPGTLSAKMNDPARFRLDEAFYLRNRFFPGQSIEYLFSREETAGAVRAAEENPAGGSASPQR